MLPGDRLVCVLVEPALAGKGFKDWPLHVTIVPWFRLETSSKTLADDLRADLAGMTPFDVQVGGAEKFGNNRQANLAEPADTFVEIEKRVRRMLTKQGAWLVDETTKRRRRFRPHVTYQNHGHLEPGDTFRCGEVYIIEQKGDYKEVVGKVELGHE